MIWTLAVQVGLALTGAPAAAAIACSLWVIKRVNSGFCPMTDGQMAVSQRAIFPVTLVWMVKALANLSSNSRDLVAVTVTSSRGKAGGDCADAAGTGSVSAASF